MHPDVLYEPSSLHSRFNRDPIPEIGRAEAVRRLMARAAGENPYPHCPRCGRAMLALARARFTCPDGHVVVTLPGRRAGLWRWVLLVFSNRRAGASA